MATITLRIEDSLRDAIQSRAQSNGTTLSEFIRELLVEAIVPTGEIVQSRGDYAPESMSVRDRQMFSLLHRILARVLPEGSDDVDGDLEYQLERAVVLERGFTAEYSDEFAGMRPELSRRDSTRVMDILEMYRMLDFSVRELADTDTPIDDVLERQLHYEGFDFNDSLEGHMANYVKYLLASGRWEERQEDVDNSDRGNSHSPRLDVYLRMLNEYRQIVETRPPMDRWRKPLSREDLQAIANARVHPSNRGRPTGHSAS